MDDEWLVDRDHAAITAVQRRIVIGTGNTHVDIPIRVAKTPVPPDFPFYAFRREPIKISFPSTRTS